MVEQAVNWLAEQTGPVTVENYEALGEAMGIKLGTWPGVRVRLKFLGILDLVPENGVIKLVINQSKINQFVKGAAGARKAAHDAVGWPNLLNPHPLDKAWFDDWPQAVNGRM